MSAGFAAAQMRAPLLTWYYQGQRQLPWRQRFSQSRDPYHVWVSEIMLQQTVIKAVIPVYERFLNKFPDLLALARADEADVREAVRGLGYYRRFRLLHQASRDLAARLNGSEYHKPWPPAFPRTFDAWRELPGVGDYTAAAVSSIAFGEHAAVVDGNVERVFCRLLDLREPPNSPPLKREFRRIAQELVDPKVPGDFNQALMELGQLVCTPTKPDCASCPLTKICFAFARGSQSLAPAAKAKPQAVDVRLQLMIATDAKGRVALVERPVTAKFLKGTWGFPTWIDGLRDGHDAGPKKFGDEPMAIVRHTITRHKIKAEVHAESAANLPEIIGGEELRWHAGADVERHLLSNLDRKAWIAWTARRQLGDLFARADH